MNENLKLIIGLGIAFACVIGGRELLNRSRSHATAPQHTAAVVKPFRSSAGVPLGTRGGRIDWDDPAVQDAVIPPKRTTKKTQPATPEELAARAAARQQAVAARAERIRAILGDDPEGVLPAISAAEEATSLVGTDSDAELVWMTAVNDPDVPAEIRKDLIRDLGEQGISDPQNPSEEDLPLILSRIEMIEAIAPESLDDTNATAFADSYKDLVKMADQIRQNQQEMSERQKNETLSQPE